MARPGPYSSQPTPSSASVTQRSPLPHPVPHWRTSSVRSSYPPPNGAKCRSRHGSCRISLRQRPSCTHSCRVSACMPPNKPCRRVFSIFHSFLVSLVRASFASMVLAAHIIKGWQTMRIVAFEIGCNGGRGLWTGGVWLGTGVTRGRRLPSAHTCSFR